MPHGDHARPDLTATEPAEKGMGLIVPGFVPTPLGEIFEYSPTWTEVFVSLGIWATGIMVFTLLTKVAVAIELGHLRERS